MKDKFLFSLCDLRGLCGEKITFCSEVFYTTENKTGQRSTLMPERKIADHLREAFRLRGYSIRTEKAYPHWYGHFVCFHQLHHSLNPRLRVGDGAPWSPSLACPSCKQEKCLRLHPKSGSRLSPSSTAKSSTETSIPSSPPPPTAVIYTRVYQQWISGAQPAGLRDKIIALPNPSS